MIRPVLLCSACCFVMAANAASLQDPSFTTANYTTLYAGGLNMGRNELNGINNNGVAVGEYASISPKLSPPYAEVYENFRYQPVPNVPSTARLNGINDNGTFVGYGILPSTSGVSSFVSSYTSPNIFSPVVALNVPGASATYAYAINNQGTIVGGYIGGTDGLEHGFIYRTDGSFQTLDDPTSRNTTLLGINNLGQIVGTGGIDLNDRSQTGFLYSANSFLDFSYGRPVGINDMGAIAMNTTANGGGVLYPDGTLAIVIASTVFPGSPSVGPALAAINNQGTLIFNSAFAFIATPVPEPSSLALLTFGAVGLASTCFLRRRCA